MTRGTITWRRWAALGLYVGLLLVRSLTRADDPLAIALYLPTLPWSAFSYGTNSPLLGWTIITVGGVLNAALAFGIGAALDSRATVTNGAA